MTERLEPPGSKAARFLIILRRTLRIIGEFLSGPGATGRLAP
ncbi:MAG: hypothetical protein ACP5OS_08500 [Leptospirillia bacterium]